MKWITTFLLWSMGFLSMVQAQSDYDEALTNAVETASTDMEKAFEQMFSLLESAVEENAPHLAGKISKTPLYTSDAEGFSEVSGKLLDRDLSLTERVFVLHQRARFNVTVMADYDAAFGQLMQIRKVLEEKEDHVMHPIVMADVYYLAYWIKHVQHDLKSSRKYCKLLLDHSRSVGLRSMELTALMGFAELDQHSGKVEEGLKQLQDLENEVLETKNNHLIYRLYSLLSNAYKDAGDDESAVAATAKGYPYIDQNNLPLMSHHALMIARGYFDRGDIDSAAVWANRSLDYAEQSGYQKELKDISQVLSNIYKEQQNWEQAFEHLEKYLALYKEQTSLESAANIANLEQELEDERHRAEVLEKEEQVVEKEARIRTQRMRLILLVVVLGLVGVLLFIAIRSYRLKKRDASVISEQRDLVEAKNKEILDSIKYAKRLQDAILPSPKLVKEYLQESFILYKPKDIVAGDFYWMDVQGDSILYAAADCTGHGVPGAMVSVVCANALNKSVSEEGILEPAKILDRTRELVVEYFGKSGEDIKDGMDIAFVKLTGNQLEYAGANNPLWVIRNSAPADDQQSTDQGPLREVKPDKQPIGAFQREHAFTNHRLTLKKGDAVYVFSDGYADQFGGEKGKKFKTSNLKELLISIREKPMKEQRELLDRQFESWRGGLEQLDDVCIIGVKL